MLTRTDLKNRLGPVLSDGVRVADLIDIDRREVSLRVLNDPEIHELELKRIFARSWIVVGHVAEIPKPGDYMLRYIGEDQVIVVRNADGSVNILLNVCSHRAMEVCRSEHGNSHQFQCPYHGWVFDTKGALLGAPYEKLMYEPWNKAAKGYELLNARVAIQSGIIFGNFDPDAKSLDDYLGEFKYYLEFNLGDDPDELVAYKGLAGGTGRGRLGMNWKIMNDQACGDHYHSVGIHKNSLDASWKDRTNLPSPYSAACGTEDGHVLWNLGFNNPPFLVTTPDETCEMTGDGTRRVVFPSNRISGGAVGGRSAASVTIGCFLPKGPTDCDRIDITVMRKDSPYNSRAEGTSNYVHPDQIGGPIADIFADDNTQGPSVQRALRGVVAKNFVTMKYPAQNGPQDRPRRFAGPAMSWPEAAGYAYVGTQKDENQWAWWKHYFDVITAEE